VEDVDGNRFVDWVAGVSVLNLGHRHPRLVQALERQSARVWHALELPTEVRVDFLRELHESLPGTLRHHAKVLFTVTGGDAVETAVNLADYVQGRPGTVAFAGAYHGVHGGAVNLTSGRRYHATSSFRGGNILRVPFPDLYHPVWDPKDSAQPYLRYLEHVVTDPHSGFDSVSSILVEPILGEGGYVVPPDDFLPGLRELCDRHDLLLIFDEIQTGMGRTGKLWAGEHWKVTPDLMCVAKSIGGGLPLSLVVYRNDLPKALPAGFHLGTYRANPLALAVGAETLRVMREPGFLSQVEQRGKAVRQRFEDMARSHPSVGDVRGKGFMIGVELVADPMTRSAGTERAKAMRQELLSRGVLMHTCGAFDQVLRFMAPLIIEDELLERGLAQFEGALEALDASPSGRAPPGQGIHATIPRLPRDLPPPVHPPPAPPPPGRTLP
jgi:4-aminobutyrate aminotransferase-like enzyme